MPVELRLSRRFLKSLKGLSDADYRQVEQALSQLQAVWGVPHAHMGLAVRRLQGRYFECRAGLAMRVVFRAGSDGLELVFAGDHTAVQRFLRNA